MKTAPKIDHLERPTKAWFREIVKGYDLESHHLRILLAAAEMWDRSASARDAIAEHGTMVLDRYGCWKANPACEVERSSKTLFLKAIRELGLDVEGRDEPARPPALGAGRGRS